MVEHLARNPGQGMTGRNPATSRTVVAGLLLTLTPYVATGDPGDTEVVSLRAGSPAVARSGSCGPGGKPLQCISADGRFVVFGSESPDIVPNDTNGVSDIFLRDRVLQQTRRISLGAGGAQANGHCQSPVISADGMFVAYESKASNLVAGDTNGSWDAFVVNLGTGLTERVSLTDLGKQASGFIVGESPTISDDGRFVAFDSLAALVGDDTNDTYDVYVRDRQARTTARLSVSSTNGDPDDGSGLAAISADGHVVTFTSDATNLVAGDANGMPDVFVRDRQAGTTERVSVGSGGPGDWGYQSAISGDGRYIAFWTTAPLDPADTNGRYDIYVRDRVTKVTEGVSVSSTGRQAKRDSLNPSISADGRYVAFESDASNLVPGDTNSSRDVFVRDRWAGTTERVSVASSGAEGNAYSATPSLSADGRLVAFISTSTNLGAGELPAPALYLHEMGGPKTTSYVVEPPALDYGQQTITTRRSQAAAIRNTGTVPIWVDTVALSGPSAAQFRLANPCRGWLQPTARCAVTVTFAPTSIGSKTAALDVTAAAGVLQSVSLTGEGVKGAFAVAPAALDFGDVAVGAVSAAQYVTITNTGLGVLPIKSIYIEGTDAAQFRRAHDCPTTVVVGGSCTVRVRFAPTQSGPRQATLTIRGGGGAGTKRVAVLGDGR
jgi:Tol biopolymer transport system component